MPRSFCFPINAPRVPSVMAECSSSNPAAPSAPAAHSSEASPYRAAQPVTIAHSQIHDMAYPPTGEVYRIMVWIPDAEPPASGFPVVFMTDANANFGMATDIIRARSRRRDATGMVPAILVGMGYPEDGPYAIDRRAYDLTPPADTPTLPTRPNGVPWPRTGGADAYLDFLLHHVRPMISTLAPIDLDHQTLVGHSFGGLFALHTLFSQPTAFDTYVAGSPSIWFNNRQILEEAQTALPALIASGLQRRLFIAVGGLEERLTPAEQAQADAATRETWKSHNRMIGNAQDLATTLAGTAALTTQFEVYNGEDHASILPQFLNRGLRFALTQNGSEK